jgi:cobalt/nickel transport system permease protein
MLLNLVSNWFDAGGNTAPLHAPDGFFSLPVAAVGWVISVAIIGFAVRKTGKDLNERLIPMMGIMAAFVFAAQMINFPVPGGTSGHLVGGALAAVILGPWAAILVMTAVVSVQALLFQDGGLVALGINLLNMAIISSLLGYGIWWVFKRFGTSMKPLMFGGFAAGWVSIVIASVAVAVQLSISGTSPLILALPALAGVHALIGIGEGLITVGALSFIRAARPNMLPTLQMRRNRSVEANQA